MLQFPKHLTPGDVRPSSKVVGALGLLVLIRSLRGHFSLLASKSRRKESTSKDKEEADTVTKRFIMLSSLIGLRLHTILFEVLCDATAESNRIGLRIFKLGATRPQVRVCINMILTIRSTNN